MQIIVIEARAYMASVQIGRPEAKPTVPSPNAILIDQSNMTNKNLKTQSTRSIGLAASPTLAGPQVQNALASPQSVAIAE
jgi:hypothetical protein